MSEEFRRIEGWDGYWISSQGRLYSDKSKRFLKTDPDKYGYPKATLYAKGRSKTTPVHRLVATAFIPNPDNLATVNHINEIKTDNRVQNLEWMSFYDNQTYGTAIQRMVKARCHKPVIHTLPDGSEVRYDGVKDAWRKTGIYWSQIARMCRGEPNRYRNGSWRYADD